MADEEMQEIKIESVPKKKLPSPWKAAAVGMAAGPLVSLAFGLNQRFRNKSYLEEEARNSINDRDERSRLSAAISGEIENADPDEKRQLEYAQGRIADGWQRIASGDREQGQKMIAEARVLVESVIGKDIDARKQEEAKQHDFQREMIGTAAKAYQQEFRNTEDAFQGINRQSQMILDLVADPTFDPNKPINKAHLAELLSMGGLMFKDTPDMMDGLTQGVSAVNGMAGGVVGGIATMFKSADFKVSAEDYNRLALNAQKYATIYAKQKIESLGAKSQNLDAAGKKLGILPNDFTVGDYVTGGEKELRMTPNPVFRGGREAIPENLRRPTSTQSLTNPFHQTGRGAQRPTN